MNKKIQVEGQFFKDKDISLDGKVWIKCTFLKCNIIIEQCNYELINCDFKDCILKARGNAFQVLRLVKLIFPQLPLNV